MNKILVWDFPLRFFHWLLVICMVGSFYTGFTGEMVWHFRCGYAILTLILFRIGWGFFGSTYARFNSFLFKPSEIFNYLRQFFNKNPPNHYVGHNPMGGISVIVLLGLILIQVISGLFSTDDIASEGPLYILVSNKMASFFTTLHKTNFKFLLLIMTVHISAVFFYLLYKKENLIKPMITGYKTTFETPYLKPTKIWISSILWVLSICLVALIVNLPIVLKFLE
ncbi:MAG: hypothetical protein RIT27_2415 [Pseudomonadota bacterium]|jgi:cytochrome b